MIYILSIISLVVLIIFLIDGIPQFNTWQSRIKIGKFQHDILWKETVLKKSLHWLNHLPSTKIKDSNHLIIIDVLKKQYSNKTEQSWQEAALLSGIYAAYKCMSSKESVLFLKECFRFSNIKLSI